MRKKIHTYSNRYWPRNRSRGCRACTESANGKLRMPEAVWRSDIWVNGCVKERKEGEVYGGCGCLVCSVLEKSQHHPGRGENGDEGLEEKQMAVGLATSKKMMMGKIDSRDCIAEVFDVCRV